MSWLSQATGIDLDTQASAPKPGQAPLSPETQALIGQQIDKASRPASAFGAELGTGMESGVSRLGAMDTSGIAQSGVTPGMQQAIRNVYAGQTGNELEKLKFGNQIAGEQRKAQAMQTASQLALHQQQMQTNYMQQLVTAQNQMEQQRAQFIAQMSGLASYGFGSYMGSKRRSGQEFYGGTESLGTAGA